MNRTIDSLVPDDVAPTTLLFGVVAALSLGWTSGSVLAGEPLVEYLPLVATAVAAGATLYVVRSGE